MSKTLPEMEKGDLLFVYGTLRKGASADLSRNMNLTYVGRDKINGEMYNVGYFPGLVSALPGNPYHPDLPSVEGDLFRVENPSVSWVLDAYEGVPTLYDRVRVRTAGLRHVWLYVYQRDTANLPLVESGDWLVETTQQIAA